MPSTFALPTYSISGWMANVYDAFGCQWGVATTQGVTDGPGVKTHFAERPYGAGAYRAPSFRSARSIVLQGWCDCPDRATTAAARARFLALFPGGSQQTLLIDDGLGPKQAKVELAGDPKCAIWSDATGFDWQLTLTATDPVFYDVMVQTTGTSLPTPGAVGLNWSPGGSGGLDWVTGGGLDWGTTLSNGQLTLWNNGNADAWPVWTFTGPLTNPMLTNISTGQVFTYSGTLVSGDSLVITTNPVGRSVLLNGSDRFTLLTAAPWFPIPPYSTVTCAFVASGGSGSLSASWAHSSW